jgi:chromate transport protein ChrA
MTDRRWRKRALIAVLVAIALFVLPSFLVVLGAPVELVGALSNLSLLVLPVALVLLAIAAYRQVRWSLALPGTALAADIAAALLLIVHAPQPAYLHREWAWYWPS